MQKTTRRKQDEARFNKLSSKQTSHAVVETNQPVAELRPCSELHSLDGVRLLEATNTDLKYFPARNRVSFVRSLGHCIFNIKINRESRQGREA